jgi:hypothetical protein
LHYPDSSRDRVAASAVIPEQHGDRGGQRLEVVHVNLPLPRRGPSTDPAAGRGLSTPLRPGVNRDSAVVKDS